MAGEKAGSDRVSFTQASAQRIADAVRSVEQGNRDGVPFVGAPRSLGGGGAGIKICTFDGAWAIDTTRDVTPLATTDTKVYTAMNLFADISGCGIRPCAIAKYGTAWYLIAAKCQ